MVQPRDYSLDFFKGITAISIIFIHTVWWTGQSYVPDFIRQYSLLLDVPLFFFLSGASATFGFEKAKPFSGIVRLILMYTLFYAVYTIIVNPANTFEEIIQTLFMKYSSTDKLMVVSGSAWFIPIFVVVYIVGFIIVKHTETNVIIPLICALLFYGIFAYEEIPFLHGLTALSVTSDFLFFYLFFFLLGYYFYKHFRFFEWHRVAGGVLFFIALTALIVHFYNIPFDLQSQKFPVKYHYLVASLLSVSLTILLSKYIKKESFITHIGKNAIAFYIAQGISSSMINNLVRSLEMDWFPKLAIVFTCNLTGAVIIAKLIIYAFGNYNKLVNKGFNYLDKSSLKVLKS
ncbi:acyltransferase family protein [Sporocytophaga myxococcoides]|uniref:acyltransferase family protein n=1 Tax=Sporocytophaga myxococcoides TaxID=153721 RepID=UPI000405C1A3|nr:acyltransferase [Sporocytophaga myxococcoides]